MFAEALERNDALLRAEARLKQPPINGRFLEMLAQNPALRRAEARLNGPPRPSGPPRQPPSPPLPPQPGGFSFANPPPIKLGYYRHANGIGDPLLSYTENALVLFGLCGAGKMTRFLTELLMTTSHRSLFVTDLKGECAYQCGAERARYSKVYYFNPYRMHGLPHHGCNVLAPLRCDDPLLFDKCKSISEAMIEATALGESKHWSTSAQGLTTAACMFEVRLAAQEHRAPSLLSVRRILVEADRFDYFVGSGGKRMKEQVAGLKYQTKRMLNCGDPTIADLIGRFDRDHGLNELASIQSTFDSETQWLNSHAMKAALEQNDFDIASIRREPVTIFYMLPIDEIENKRPLTRIMLSAALNAHRDPGPMSTLFVLDEFRAAVGDLPILRLYWSLVRGFRAQIMPILQSATQLKTLFKEEWENYLAQAGLVATLGPPKDATTASWMSEESGKTTVLVKSYNEGRGDNSGGGVNGGASQADRGIQTSQGQAFNHGENVSGGLSVAQVERRAFSPQELRNLAEGNGRIWLPGHGSGSIPFYAPPYWKRRASWVSRVRPNPYRMG